MQGFVPADFIPHKAAVGLRSVTNSAEFQSTQFIAFEATVDVLVMPNVLRGQKTKQNQFS